MNTLIISLTLLFGVELSAPEPQGDAEVKPSAPQSAMIESEAPAATETPASEEPAVEQRDFIRVYNDLPGNVYEGVSNGLSLVGRFLARQASLRWQRLQSLVGIDEQRPGTTTASKDCDSDESDDCLSDPPPRASTR